MKRVLFIFALLLVSGFAQGQTLRVAHIFSDHAVFQQDSSVPVWGWGTPGKAVQVKWDGACYKTQVQADSTWRITLTTGKADGTARTLSIKSGKESITLQDIVLGEVWICSGQSNMEMPLAGFGFQGVEGGTDAIMSAPETATDVRIFNIKTPRRYKPIADVDATWQYSTSNVAAWTSAIAYFFGRRLTKTLGVPVGIIANPWGGSRIECWMTREALDASGITAEERAAIDAVEEHLDRWPETPELIWNGRVKPIAGYAAKGILWYQGCSNIGQKCYDKLQKAMVELWRREWGRDLPFIFTLLAPYDHGDSNGRWRPHFIQTQLNTEKILPQSWAVCAETLGDQATIHPPKKREIADMMVQRALQNVYGMETGISIELPRLDKVEFCEDGTVKVRLTQIWSNLGSMSSRKVIGCELAGQDRQFHLADAEVDWDGQTLIVRCADVPHPVAVRYGFRNWMGANLTKTNGIPVPPFRSDDWEY